MIWMNHRRPKRHLSTSPGLAPLTSPNLFMIGSAAAPGSMLCFSTKKRPFDAGTWWSRSRSGQFFQTNPFDMLTLPQKNDGKWMVWCCTSSKKISRGIAECWAWSLDLAILFLSTSSCKEWLCGRTPARGSSIVLYIYIIFIRYTQEYMYVYAFAATLLCQVCSWQSFRCSLEPSAAALVSFPMFKWWMMMNHQNFDASMEYWDLTCKNDQTRNLTHRFNRCMELTRIVSFQALSRAHPWRSWQRPSGVNELTSLLSFLKTPKMGVFNPCLTMKTSIYCSIREFCIRPMSILACFPWKIHEHPLIWGYSLITRQLYMQRRRWVMELYRDEVGPTVGWWLCGIPWKMGIPIKWPTVGGGEWW